MPEQSGLYGISGRFDDADSLLAAVHRLREQGYTRIEAFTPFPVEGLAEVLPGRSARLPLWALLGGLAGAAASYGLQVYSAVFDYPLNVGGRPLHSWPAFVPLSIEFTLLGAALALVIGLLVTSRLPQLRHPLFAVSGFESASQEAFFLCLRVDEGSDTAALTGHLAATGATDIQEVAA